MRWVRGITAALSALALLAHGADASAVCGKAYTPLEQRYSKGLLFKVEKTGAPASYIFGTIHLASTEVARIATEAILMLAQVKAAGFELAEPEEAIRKAAAQEMKLPPGPAHLKAQLGEPRYARLLELMKGTSLPPQALERLKPWAIAVALEFIGEEGGEPLDEKIRAVALQAGKPVFGIEKLEEQERVFSAMPAALQLRMLKETIDHYAQEVEIKHAMIKAYIRQDARALYALGEQEFGGREDDHELNDYLQERLIDGRNKIMEQRLRPRFARQSVLVSVGALHLMGPKGLLHLLEQDGYCITPIRG